MMLVWGSERSVKLALRELLYVALASSQLVLYSVTLRFVCFFAWSAFEPL